MCCRLLCCLKLYPDVVWSLMKSSSRQAYMWPCFGVQCNILLLRAKSFKLSPVVQMAHSFYDCACRQQLYCRALRPLKSTLSKRTSPESGRTVSCSTATLHLQLSQGHLGRKRLLLLAQHLIMLSQQPIRSVTNNLLSQLSATRP